MKVKELKNWQVQVVKLVVQWYEGTTTWWCKHERVKTQKYGRVKIWIFQVHDESNSEVSTHKKVKDLKSLANKDKLETLKNMKRQNLQMSKSKVKFVTQKS